CCTCGGLRPADRRGVITVTMTLPTLLGLRDDPALIPGWGPVLAEIARHVALDQAHPPSWQYAITDSHGHLPHARPIRRRPTPPGSPTARPRPPPPPRRGPPPPPPCARAAPHPPTPPQPAAPPPTDIPTPAAAATTQPPPTPSAAPPTASNTKNTSPCTSTA